jgi:hypothetical protein
MALGRQKLLQTASCLVCVVVAQRNSFELGGTEFSRGHLTGPILVSLEIGSLLFVVALVLTFVRPRIAAALSIAASLLCLPFYLYFTAPSSVWRGVLGSAAGEFCLGQKRDRGGFFSRRYDVHLCLESADSRAPTE